MDWVGAPTAVPGGGILRQAAHRVGGLAQDGASGSVFHVACRTADLENNPLAGCILPRRLGSTPCIVGVGSARRTRSKGPQTRSHNWRFDAHAGRAEFGRQSPHHLNYAGLGCRIDCLTGLDNERSDRSFSLTRFRLRPTSGGEALALACLEPPDIIPAGNSVCFAAPKQVTHCRSHLQVANSGVFWQIRGGPFFHNDRDGAVDQQGFRSL